MPFSEHNPSGGGRRPQNQGRRLGLLRSHAGDGRVAEAGLFGLLVGVLCEHQPAVMAVPEPMVPGLPVAEVQATVYSTDPRLNLDWVAPDMPVAQCVDDAMNYAAAFDAARRECGPGACFLWHGMVFSTLSDNEICTMSLADFSRYERAFVWEQFAQTGAEALDGGECGAFSDILDFMDRYNPWPLLAFGHDFEADSDDFDLDDLDDLDNCNADFADSPQDYLAAGF